jgi:hypothetical protein
VLQNPVYTGDFRWLGKIYRGSHTPLISHETFARIQDVLQHKPRPLPEAATSLHGSADLRPLRLRG